MIPYHITEIGGGRVRPHGDALMLTVPPTGANTYHDAQISDYTLSARDFAWTTPASGETAELSVRARFNTAGLRGTAGFGLWNHPFSPDMRGLPRLPQAAWFFYAGPSNNIPLAAGVPGHGWKAAVIDATRPAFLALTPFAPVGFLLMRVPALYNELWHTGQAALGVHERLLAPALLTETHTYGICWERERLTFTVDDAEVLAASLRLRGRLGFIAWIDNQYAIVTPQGRFGWGLADVPMAQTLHLEQITLKPPAPRTAVPGSSRDKPSHGC